MNSPCTPLSGSPESAFSPKEKVAGNENAQRQP